MQINNMGLYEGSIAAGLRLATIPVKKGGWKEYLSEGKKRDLSIADDMTRAQTAILLENAKRRMFRGLPRTVQANWQRLDETTRSALVGGFSDYLFPIIRAGFPTNPVNELISVQPTTRRTATIVYWNWIVGSTKGEFVQGQKLFDANTGKQTRDIDFTNEVIRNEPQVNPLTAAAATITGTLAFNDGGGVRPGTVSLTLQITTGTADVVFVDNGNGGFVATGVTISASSIDYKTGAWSITIAAETFTTAATNVATYRWDSEGSAMTPQVDVQIVTNTVETERRAMRINYSAEGMQDVMAEFGVSLEPNLIAGAAEQMNYEIARQIISEVWAVAPVAASFSLGTPFGTNGISQQEHFRDIIFQLTQASNHIWARTQKGYGNWIVVDEGAANLIESLPASMFVRGPKPASVHGLHYIGDLMGTFRVYKDRHLDKEPGASAQGNILMGFKGTNFFEAGFVWSPYQLLYTTISLQTADFLTQKGLASRYATKMVNPDMYARINLVA